MIYDYFKQNVWLIINGEFSTAMLRYAVSEITGVRTPFSVDCPYETKESACLNFNHRIGRDKVKTPCSS
jgi:hypothetical protein